MTRRIDWRTFGIMLGIALLGAVWAIYNYISVGNDRSEEQLRPLVWVIFATPFALFIGWVLARRAEVWRAAFICFCFYFFTPFVAARIESFMLTPEQAAASGHSRYFVTAIVLHVIGAVGLSLWRALDPPAPATEPAQAVVTSHSP